MVGCRGRRAFRWSRHAWDGRRHPVGGPDHSTDRGGRSGAPARRRGARDMGRDLRQGRGAARQGARRDRVLGDTNVPDAGSGATSRRECSCSAGAFLADMERCCSGAATPSGFPAPPPRRPVARDGRRHTARPTRRMARPGARPPRPWGEARLHRPDGTAASPAALARGDTSRRVGTRAAACAQRLQRAHHLPTPRRTGRPAHRRSETAGVLRADADPAPRRRARTCAVPPAVACAATRRRHR